MWKNWRPDYSRKSNQGASKRTRLQKCLWKQERLAFLAPIIVHKSGKGIEIGGGAKDEVTQEGSGTKSQLPVPTSSTVPAVTTCQEESSPRPGRSTSASLKRESADDTKKSGREVSTNLSQLLEENRKKDTELSLKTDQSTEQASERDAACLGSVVLQVPSIRTSKHSNTLTRDIHNSTNASG
ncbi:uncharacterized protein LOC124286328 [Haliotis rubra]|uniref:uncharacterized protein LOC124286328 n=1 Tax=Haliotis rubra TaxID=36100 RepID=UPI001EE5939C|nr:uncharacterized protein LOC124286328 [Haliotis rubra]XP_046578650.1 uncharacterized protein LOC124286328 [Haliotis rubra]